MENFVYFVLWMLHGFVIGLSVKPKPWRILAIHATTVLIAVWFKYAIS